MSFYYKLYDYCKKTTENNNIKKLRLLKNKETKEKNFLFKKITEDAYNIIKTRVDEEYDNAILYDDEYNKLILELLDTISIHFKPFNVYYIKKNTTDRSFIEIFKDESNYILVIDWSSINLNDTIQNINELPDKSICNENCTIEIKIENNETTNNEIIEDDFEKIF
jgi:hypothetical protein